MAWYAYCIAERSAFPELSRHRRPMPLTGVTGLFGNQTFLFPAADLAVVVSEHICEFQEFLLANTGFKLGVADEVVGFAIDLRPAWLPCCEGDRKREAFDFVHKA